MTTEIQPTIDHAEATRATLDKPAPTALSLAMDEAVARFAHDLCSKWFVFAYLHPVRFPGFRKGAKPVKPCRAPHFQTFNKRIKRYIFRSIRRPVVIPICSCAQARMTAPRPGLGYFFSPDNPLFCLDVQMIYPCHA